MIRRRSGAATTGADAAALHLVLTYGEPAVWHPITPRGGWTLDAAEAAARELAPTDPSLAARAFGILVRAAGLGRLDVAERLGGTDRRAALRDGR